MGSTPNPPTTAEREDEEDAAAYLSALQLSAGASIPMVLKAAIELDVLEIIVRAGPKAHLSPSEIVAQFPTASPDAPVLLDRMMRFLAAHSVLTSTSSAADGGGGGERRYGLAPVCSFFTRNRDGASLTALLRMNMDPVFMDSWQQLKYVVLEGVIPFTKAHGMTAFEYTGTNPNINKLFNENMASTSTLIVGKILDSYQGFESITQLVDVGGGTGAALGMIVAKHPHIKGINFDLPHVISDAPPLPGLEHVGGDMFVNIPRGDNIFMKSIIHDWSDEHCLKIMKNCRKALPEGGKVIVADTILPETPETNSAAQIAFFSDLCMLTYTCGGKERTEEEFRSLGMAAGFTRFELVCCGYSIWVMEFYK